MSNYLIIGGSGALGRVVCRLLGTHGDRVAFTYLKQESFAMELVASLPGGLALPLDLTCLADIERTIELVANQFGRIDGMAQCAAIGVSVEKKGKSTHEGLEQIDETAWDQMMAINAKGSFFVAKAAANQMRLSGGGNMVFVGSIDGLKSVPAPIHYAASKGALAAMTRALAKELGKDQICVNTLAPGILDDGLSRDLPAELKEEYLKHCALRRFGRMEEVANLIVWLLRKNRYVTGQNILIDGAL